MKGLAATLILFLLIAGHEPPVMVKLKSASKDTIVAVVPQAVPVPVPDTIITRLKKEEPTIKTSSVNPQAVVEYAETLIGTPYLYGSTDPRKGFDCSGFITYVFNHFNVKVPRSSVEFTDVGEEVNVNGAKSGDLILFTGTDSTIRVVGHMGIVVSNENDKLFFIHSTSGKQYGVTVTELSPYYMSRFVRIARVFPDGSSTVVAAHIENNANHAGTTSLKNNIPAKNTLELNSAKKVDSTKVVKKKTVTKKTVTKKPVTKKSTSKSVTKSKKTSTVKKSSQTPSKVKAPSKKKPSSGSVKKKQKTPNKSATSTTKKVK